MITLIWAQNDNGVIGRENGLPWSNQKGDMAFFKKTTVGRTALMGRKTFESMGKKPLPFRKNIVITSDEDYDGNGATVIHSLKEAMDLARAEEVFVIGGKMIYDMFMPYARRMLVTRIFSDEAGDTYAPEHSWLDWNIALVGEIQNRDEDNDAPYMFIEYKRSRPSVVIDLYFLASDGEERFLATVENDIVASDKISEFLGERNWKSPYWRWMGTRGKSMMVDVGSHTEFFKLEWRTEEYDREI